MPRRSRAVRPARPRPAPRRCRASVRSMSSSSEEVKSPTNLLDVAMVGLAAEHRHVEQEPGDRPTSAPSVPAKDAATAIAGVMPRRCAAANRASRVAGSSEVPAPGVAARVGLFGARHQRQRRRFRQIAGSAWPTTRGRRSDVAGCRRRRLRGTAGRCSPARVARRRGRARRGRPSRCDSSSRRRPACPGRRAAGSAVRQQRQRQFEHVAVRASGAIWRRGSPAADRRRPSTSRSRRSCTVTGQFTVADPLGAVGQDLDPQHRVPSGQLRGRRA